MHGTLTLNPRAYCLPSTTAYRLHRPRDCRCEGYARSVRVRIVLLSSHFVLFRRKTNTCQTLIPNPSPEPLVLSPTSLWPKVWPTFPRRPTLPTQCRLGAVCRGCAEGSEG
eukprot:2793477-Pyramimonas_sp.AAC.1